MDKNDSDWVQLNVISSFTKIKKLCGGTKKKQSKVGKQSLANAIDLSSILELDATRSRVRRITPLPGRINMYQLFRRCVVIRKVSSSLFDTSSVRMKIKSKCQDLPWCSGDSSGGSIERVLFVRSKETPTDVVREAYMMEESVGSEERSKNKSENKSEDKSEDKSEEDRSKDFDDLRGVDVRKERAALIVVVLRSTDIAYDVVARLDEPNNWRGGLCVEMINGEKIPSRKKEEKTKMKGREGMKEETRQRREEEEERRKENQKIQEEENRKNHALACYEETKEEKNVRGVIITCKNNER